MGKEVSLPLPVGRFLFLWVKKMRQEYSKIEVDFFPDGKSEEIIYQFLSSLRQMAEALEKSSEESINGGAGFNWKIKITAKGEWS